MSEWSENEWNKWRLRAWALPQGWHICELWYRGLFSSFRNQLSNSKCSVQVVVYVSCLRGYLGNWSRFRSLFLYAYRRFIAPVSVEYVWFPESSDFDCKDTLCVSVRMSARRRCALRNIFKVGIVLLHYLFFSIMLILIYLISYRHCPSGHRVKENQRLNSLQVLLYLFGAVALGTSCRRNLAAYLERHS